MKKFDITTPADVAKFFFWLVFEVGVNFHPDDTFLITRIARPMNPTFPKEDAIYYDKVMESCIVVCQQYGRDIYQMATKIIGLYHYCDCNDTLAAFCDNYDAIKSD